MNQRVHILLAIYCCLPLKIVCFSSDTPLEETKFSFTSGYKLEIASELGMGLGMEPILWGLEPM